MVTNVNLLADVIRAEKKLAIAETYVEQYADLSGEEDWRGKLDQSYREMNKK